MTIFKTIMGITLLTTSLTGEATGKLGRYSATATEYVSWAGKNATAWTGDIAYATSKGINNLGNNDFTKITSNLTNATSNLAYCASNILEAVETTSKNSKKLFGNLETNSQRLRSYATNLIRDEEYRDLNAKFNFKSNQVTSQVDEEDWTLINEIKPEKSKSFMELVEEKHKESQKRTNKILTKIYLKALKKQNLKVLMAPRVR